MKRLQLSAIAYVILGAPSIITTLYDLIGESNVLNSLFLSAVRPCWGIAMAWVIFNFHCGHGGLLNKFLSSRLWVPIGKLGFSLYLVSSVIQYNFNSSKNRQLNLSALYMVRLP